jgi:hypothetical protein
MADRCATAPSWCNRRGSAHAGAANGGRKLDHKRRTEMSVYVAEINGRGIAAFSAETRELAEKWAQGGPFQEDLTVLENEGTPLWNGTDENSRP